MKKNTFHILLFSFFVGFFWTISVQNALALDASISYSTYKANEQAFIELNLFVIGQSIAFKPVDKDSVNYQAGVEVLILFRQGEAIVKGDRYNLRSRVTDKFLDLMDIKRYVLPEGTYNLSVTFKDLGREKNAQTYKKDISIGFEKEKLGQAEIQLLSVFKQDSMNSVFAKSGFYMEALPFNYCDLRTTHLKFYDEFYGADKLVKDDIVFGYFIERLQGEKALQPTILTAYKKQKPQAVNALLYQFDITELPSGSYRLTVEARNRAKELLSRRSVDFERSNPLLRLRRDSTSDKLVSKYTFIQALSNDDLAYSLRAIAMKVSGGDDSKVIQEILKTKNIEAQRRELLNYWINANPNQPEQAYNDYMKVARAIDKEYANGFRTGFETDRGRMYMKYGQPNDILSVEDDPTAPPYEIWLYQKVEQTKQTNVKLLFYNPTLVSNGHILLHTNLRGETNNPQWKTTLYKNAQEDFKGNGFDETEVKDNFNRNASRYLEDF
jgi:GWxTD domain-containing protein